LIAVPDFGALSDLYQENKDLKIIEKALMGGQDYQYNYHKSVYDITLLQAKLKNTGFENVDRYDTLGEFGKDIGDFSTYQINGRLISLNVRAIKN
jgi:hypothetical protein